MKKNLLILAVAGLALASCNSDETIAVNEGDAISFRSNMDNLMRAADITSADDIASIYAYATKTSDPSTVYFSNVEFVGPTTYNSATKYYWPSYYLDFYAWSAKSVSNGDATAQVSTSAYNSYVITPTADAANQPDFIYATATNVAKTTTGVPLDFSHKESRILLKVKNTSANISFSVTGWRLGFMVPNGTFNGTTWTSLGTADADKIYTSTFAAQTVSPNTTTAAAITGAHSQIMIPQAVSPVTAYASAADDAKPNNAYIAIQYTATNTITSESIVGSATWAIWKIPAVTWEAGKQYTYVIDMADGGYFEKNTNDGNADLDPVLSDGFIKFASVTITNWDTTPGEIPATY